MKHRVLIVTQVYPPDPAAVGQHVGDVAEQMAVRGWEVVVYCSGRGYDDPSVRYQPREMRQGVDVRRLPLSSFGKGGIAIRLLAQSLFMMQALIRVIATTRPSVILVSTSPPFAGFGAAILGWLRRAPIVWWVMDINPDQLVRSGKLCSRSFVARIFDLMNRFTLNRARDVIVLDRFMRETMVRKALVSDKIHVIPPWAHDDHLVPVAHTENPFRRHHRLDGKFVVMYSGNAGYSTPLETLLQAAKRLEHDTRLVFVFIGGGVIKKRIDEMVARERPPNIRTFPYQPMSEIRYSLSAADVHVVSLADEAVGVVHPCKIYGAMAVGRPIIALAADESYAADILTAHRAGWRFCHGDVDGLTSLLQSLPELPPDELRRMADAGAKAAATQYARTTSLSRVCDIIEGKS